MHSILRSRGLGEGNVQSLCIALDQPEPSERFPLEISFLVDSCVMARIYSLHLESSSVALVDPVAGHEAIGRIRSQSREYEQARSFGIIDHRNFAEMSQSLRENHAASRSLLVSSLFSNRSGQTQGSVSPPFHLNHADTFQAHFLQPNKRNRFCELRGFMKEAPDFKPPSIQGPSRI
jgi:hypothetical protein